MNPAPEPPIDCGPALLRRFRSDDLEELVELADDADVSANLRDTFPHPYTREDGLRWLGLTTGELRETNFVIEVDGRFAGGSGPRYGVPGRGRNRRGSGPGAVATRLSPICLR